jgi:hypothetical protein
MGLTADKHLKGAKTFISNTVVAASILLNPSTGWVCRPAKK